MSVVDLINTLTAFAPLIGLMAGVSVVLGVIDSVIWWAREAWRHE